MDGVILSTGPVLDPAADPLLSRLIEQGVVRAHPLRIGLDVDDGGRVRAPDGEAWPTLHAMGGLRKGAEWESTAIPEIRWSRARHRGGGPRSLGLPGRRRGGRRRLERRRAQVVEQSSAARCRQAPTVREAVGEEKRPALAGSCSASPSWATPRSGRGAPLTASHLRRRERMSTPVPSYGYQDRASGPSGRGRTVTVAAPWEPWDCSPSGPETRPSMRTSISPARSPASRMIDAPVSSMSRTLPGCRIRQRTFSAGRHCPWSQISAVARWDCPGNKESDSNVTFIRGCSIIQRGGSGDERGPTANAIRRAPSIEILASSTRPARPPVASSVKSPSTGRPIGVRVAPARSS